MLKLVIGFMGIFAGMVLSYLAREEIPQGKTYFRTFHVLLFASIIFLSLFYLIQFQLYGLLIVFSSVTLILFLLDLRYHHVLFRLGNYFFLGLPFFFLVDLSFRLLLPSLLFLYGLPLGILLREP